MVAVRDGSVTGAMTSGSGTSGTDAAGFESGEETGGRLCGAAAGGGGAGAAWGTTGASGPPWTVWDKAAAHGIASAIKVPAAQSLSLPADICDTSLGKTIVRQNLFDTVRRGSDSSAIIGKAAGPNHQNHDESDQELPAHYGDPLAQSRRFKTLTEF